MNCTHLSSRAVEGGAVTTVWCCRFTSALEVLLELREQLQKLQQQDQKYNSADASEVSAPVGEVQNAAASLCIKLLEK